MQCLLCLEAYTHLAFGFSLGKVILMPQLPEKQILVHIVLAEAFAQPTAPRRVHHISTRRSPYDLNRLITELPRERPEAAFGALISAARKARRLPLREISRQILKTNQQPISVQYLHNLERGARFPSADLIPQFARVLEIPVDTLYFTLRLLPPDLYTKPTTLRHIQTAFQIMRTTLWPPDDGTPHTQ